MHARKHILILTSTFPRWADDTDPPFMYTLSKHLAESFAVHVLCPRTRGAQPAEVRAGVRIQRFPYCFSRFEILAYGTGILSKLRQKPVLYGLVPFFILGECIAAARMITSTGCAVVNAHWLLPQGLAAWAALTLVRSKAHLVCSLHGGDIFALRRLRALKAFVLKRCSAVVVVSNVMRDAVIELGVPAEKIRVIPMGVDLRHAFVPPARARTNKSILFVGRLVEKKGAKYLVRAFQSVARLHPDARLVIVGDGPERGCLQALVQQLNLERCVEIRGAVRNAELPALYQSAEIVVLPFVVDESGDMEGFGLVTVEALGCGCAVVASDVPALRDTILDRQTGLLVRQKNEADIADAVVLLLEQEHLRRELGQRGRAFVQERYDWRQTIEKYVDLFEK